MELLIPTRDRTKIPSGLSYPVGAEAISAALAGVRQFPDLSLSFWCLWPAEVFRVPPESDAFLPVVEASFEKVSPGATGSRAGAEKGWYSEKWHVYVYPVPSGAKARVRQGLVDVGLPLIRGWLEASRQPTWLYGRHTGLVSARLDDGEVILEEDPPDR